MSPKLFNSVLQRVFRPLMEKWAEEGGGLEVGGKRLTNLRFADDVLLIAQSAGKLESMLEDMAGGAAEVGLQVHFGKKQVLCNRFGRQTEP